MIQERRVAVEEVRALSPRQFVLEYRCPEIAADCRPGQFVMISVSDAVDPLLRRPMAIYRVLRDDGDAVGFSLLIEVIGRGTRLMSACRPGDRVSVLGPLGRPFEVLDGAGEHLLVMGGIGAAPFPFLAEHLLERGLPVRAFVGGRTAEDLLCLDDFAALGVPAELATDDGSRGAAGFVTRPLQAHLERPPAPPAAVYSCGPTPMMHAVERIVRDAGLPHAVSLEAPMACGLGVCLSCVVRVRQGDGWGYQRVCREGPVFDARSLLWEEPAVPQPVGEATVHEQ